MNNSTVSTLKNKGFLAIFAVALALAVVVPSHQAAAETTYYYVPNIYGSSYSTSYQYPTTPVIGGTYGAPQQMTKDQLISYLQALIVQLQAQLQQKGGHTGGTNCYYAYTCDTIGNPRGDNDNDNDEEPDVETDSASKIEDDRATLEGSVDMNDFEDGEVFFVYGTDENAIEDVEDDFDSYGDVDEDGDDLQKVRVDSSLDDDDDYNEEVTGLDEDTEYFFQICVGYEDEDNDDVLTCGGVDDFTTDEN